MEIYLYTSEQEPNGSDETFEHCEAGTIPEAQYIVIDNSLCGRRVMGNFSDDNKITIGIANKTDCTGHVFVSVYENDVREIRIDGVSETDFITLRVHADGSITHNGKEILRLPNT